MKVRERVMAAYDKERANAAIDEVKVNVMKVFFTYHDGLTKLERELIDSALPEGCVSFDDMIDQVRQDLVIKDIKDRKEPKFWMGTRMEVEMPKVKDTGEEKSFAPEILCQKFMMTEDYHHYDDWKQMMEETFDNFNMLMVPKE